MWRASSLHARQGVFSIEAEKLAEAFWPGPLTLVLPAARGASVCAARAGGTRHDCSQGAGASGRARARRRGGMPGRRAVGQSVRARQPGDGRACARGSRRKRRSRPRRRPMPDGARIRRSSLASTGRPGCCARAPSPAPRSRPRSGFPWPRPRRPEDILAPGMLASHYAPRARLAPRRDAARGGRGRASISAAFFPPGDHVRDLSPHRDLDEAAANLFLYLRELDALGCETIAVAPIPREGLGEAINDRLARAAAPRTG